MDRGGDLDDLLGVERGIKGGINLALHKDGGLDIVNLSLGLDDGGGDGVGATQDGGDGDGEMGGGGLQNPGGIAGHVVGLAKVDLLGDDGLGLVDSGDAGRLAAGGEGGGRGRLGVRNWGVRHHRAGRVMLGPEGGGRGHGRGGHGTSIAEPVEGGEAGGEGGQLGGGGAARHGHQAGESHL